MKIIDLSKEYESLYFVCLEDWSDEMKEAGDHKQCWYNKMKDKGLGVKLCLDDNDKVGGMIQYIPIEHSFAEGKDLYFINCIWIHGYKKGRGDFRKKGMGKTLLRAAEEDIKNRGAKGVVAWGIPLPFWMKASWFKKQGYKKVDKKGFLGEVLLWKPFQDDAIPPKWIKKKKEPEVTKGKVTVTAFVNGWCSAQNIKFERAKRAAEEIGDKVIFNQIDTSDRKIIHEWGIFDAIYINKKEYGMGPPLSYQKIKRRIEKEVRKIT